MKFRITSDIHTEILPLFGAKVDEYFVDLVLPHCDEDKETNLILAGDIGSCKTLNKCLLPFLRICSNRFSQIFYIPGNHEYYYGVWHRDLKHLATAISYEEALNNVIFGGRIVYPLNDSTEKLVLIAATLWSDIDEGGGLARLDVARSINDYHVISEIDESDGTFRKLSPETTIKQFREDRDFLESQLSKYSSEGYKIVVVTHHAPSYQSSRDFVGSKLNCAFSSSLENLILDYNPHTWIHGHTHTSYSYEIGNTKVICNPYGYPRHDTNREYNSLLTIEV